MKLHLGSTFVQSLITDSPAEISYGGRGSDQSRLQGWIDSPGHNEIMLADNNDVFGCFNDPDGEYAHCNFFRLDKDHPQSGYTYTRPCAWLLFIKKGIKSALTKFVLSLWSKHTRVPNMYCTIQNEIKTGQKKPRIFRFDSFSVIHYLFRQSWWHIWNFCCAGKFWNSKTSINF